MAEKYNLNMAWKRPVSRMYEFNRQVGENYYLPMTSYLDCKQVGETPGALTYSERLARNWIKGRTEVKTKTSKQSYYSHQTTRTIS